jgi:hypothetical protein
VPVFSPSSHEQEEEAASSRSLLPATNRKKKQRVVVLIALPKNVIAGLHLSKRTPDPTNVPEATTLPRSRARNPWDGNACVQRVVSHNRKMTRRALYRGSRVSQEPGGEKASAAQLPGVEVLQHLWQLFALKRKWKNLSRPGTHVVRPAGSPTPTARPGRRQRRRARVASFCPLLNFSIKMV